MPAPFEFLSLREWDALRREFDAATYRPASQRDFVPNRLRAEGHCWDARVEALHPEVLKMLLGLEKRVRVLEERLEELGDVL